MKFGWISFSSKKDYLRITCITRAKKRTTGKEG
jgi:hypothetical protein